MLSDTLLYMNGLTASTDHSRKQPYFFKDGEDGLLRKEPLH